MNKLTTEYLYADFKSVAEYTPEYASAFFEKYADYFKTVNSLKDSADLNLYIELTWQHLHMLYVKNRYAETKIVRHGTDIRFANKTGGFQN
jgi:hypothetical protein